MITSQFNIVAISVFVAFFILLIYVVYKVAR